LLHRRDCSGVTHHATIWVGYAQCKYIGGALKVRSARPDVQDVALRDNGCFPMNVLLTKIPTPSVEAVGLGGVYVNRKPFSGSTFVRNIRKEERLFSDRPNRGSLKRRMPTTKCMDPLPRDWQRFVRHLVCCSSALSS